MKKYLLLFLLSFVVVSQSVFAKDEDFSYEVDEDIEIDEGFLDDEEYFEEEGFEEEAPSTDIPVVAEDELLDDEQYPEEEVEMPDSDLPTVVEDEPPIDEEYLEEEEISVEDAPVSAVAEDESLVDEEYFDEEPTKPSVVHKKVPKEPKIKIQETIMISEDDKALLAQDGEKAKKLFVKASKLIKKNEEEVESMQNVRITLRDNQLSVDEELDTFFNKFSVELGRSVEDDGGLTSKQKLRRKQMRRDINGIIKNIRNLESDLFSLSTTVDEKIGRGLDESFKAQIALREIIKGDGAQSNYKNVKKKSKSVGKMRKDFDKFVKKINDIIEEIRKKMKNVSEKVGDLVEEKQNLDTFEEKKQSKKLFEVSVEDETSEGADIEENQGGFWGAVNSFGSYVGTKIKNGLSWIASML